MRHSDPSLTANVYTDPKLLDVAGAVASLPDLPLGEMARGPSRRWPPADRPPACFPTAADSSTVRFVQ